jgi:hypothetical protein
MDFFSNPKILKTETFDYRYQKPEDTRQQTIALSPGLGAKGSIENEIFGL